MAKIMVIDDDQTIVDFLSTYLTDAGYAVVSALDGASGLQNALREKPDLIILDYNMPAANGAKVHERLRGNTFTSGTPIIFLTATPIGEIITNVKDDNLTRFLQKPLDFPLLNKTLAQFLGGGAPAAPPAAAPAPAPAPYKPDDPNSVGGGEILDLD